MGTIGGARKGLLISLALSVALVAGFVAASRMHGLRNYISTSGGCGDANRRALPAGDGAIAHYDPRTQITKPHIARVFSVVRSFPEAKVLVWGTGFDSPMWCLGNQDGTTVFLEDNPDWIARVQPDLPCRIVPVRYRHTLRDALRLLEQPGQLTMSLPDDIAAVKWDVILIDGPWSGRPHSPGRMQSIYMSAQLAHSGSHVFVDDFCRPPEYWYSEQYLKPVFGEPVVYDGRNGFAEYSRAAELDGLRKHNHSWRFVFRLWDWLDTRS